MTTTLITLEVQNRQQWRMWLGKHHATSPGVWLAFYKHHTGMKSIPYEDSVREALCFGWIDSLIKRLDDRRYARKFTPRLPTSKWSDINRKRWGRTQGGRPSRRGRPQGSTNRQHLRTAANDSGSTGLHRQGTQGESKSMEFF